MSRSPSGLLFFLVYQLIVKNESDNVEYEVVYEVVEVTDSDEETSSKNGSDEEVEYEYITEEVEESNDSKEAETTTNCSITYKIRRERFSSSDSDASTLSGKKECKLFICSFYSD